MKQPAASTIFATAPAPSGEPVGSDRPATGQGSGWRGLASTIPNGLSVVRMVLGLCLPWLLPSWRLPVVVAAALSDLLDGASGRLFRACSRTGRVLDPVADKVFAVAVVAVFLQEGVLSVGEVLLIGLRDLVVIAGTVAGLAMRQWAAFRRMGPSLLGKATTFAQFVFFVVLLVAPESKAWLLAPTAGLSALAAGHYLWLFLRQRSQKTSKAPKP